MDNSPKGREIEKLEGEPGPIISRGNDITELGQQMKASAALLEKIADGADGQNGLAVEKLQEVVGDVFEELKKAADRYEPTGPVLVTYGEALAELKPLISTAVADCQEEWHEYESKRSAVGNAWLTPLTPPPADPEPNPAEPYDPFKARDEAVDAAQGAADAQYEKWKDEARVFDGYYDDWEDAFEKAARDIGKATEGNISDSKWDDLDGFVAGALEVLKWVGLAVAVLGIIIGGPFLAALGAIIGIATLLLTIYSFSRGNSSGWDLAFAIVGVIPFGSMGKLFSGQKMAFLDDMAGGLLTSGGRSAITGELAGIAHGITTGFARGGGGLPGLIRGLRGGTLAWAGPNGMGAGNIISRLFTGQNMNHWNQGTLDALDVLPAVWGDGFYKNLYGIPDTIFGLGDKIAGKD